MSAHPIRRSFVLGAILASGSSRRALAQDAGLRLRGIVVDTSRVAGLRSPVMADPIRGGLGRTAAATFADRLTPGDPRASELLIRIDAVSMGAFADGAAAAEGGDRDDLEGAWTVTSRGRELSRTPVLSVLNPGYSGTWYDPDINAMRIASLTQHSAYWLRRGMGI